MNGFVNIFFDSQSTSRPTTIIGKIAKVPNVTFAFLVTGEVDAIAWVEAADSGGFGTALLAINAINGVDYTNTNVAF